MCLKIDRVREELAQLLHLRALRRPQEIRARGPWTSRFVSGKQELRQLCAAAGNKIDDLGKTFIKRPALPFWIPNEMTNPE